MIVASRDTQVLSSEPRPIVVDEAISLLEKALHEWAVADRTGVETGDFPTIYASLYSQVSDYRDFVVLHEEEFTPKVLQELLIASAELDGLASAYYHGHEHSDHRWRREADRRRHQVELARERVPKMSFEGKEATQTAAAKRLVQLSPNAPPVE